MELNEMEKKMLFQAEGDCQAKVLNELYMTVRYSNNSELRETAESLMAKVRVLSDRECMDLVRDIQKNYRLPYPPRTIGERIGIVKKTAHPTNSLRQPAPDFAPTVRACAAEEGFPHWLYCVGGGYSRSRSIGRSFAEPAPAA